MPNDIHLRVFRERSELILPNGKTEIFFEGVMDADAKRRLRNITQTLAGGYLEKRIIACQDGLVVDSLKLLKEEDFELLDKLVTAVTSEIGRALLALTIMQLSVKSIEPQQSIRLHKGGNSSKDFSWRSGISMRSLDKKFITPTLRKFDLLKLNADGFMMTRSLAENYPYSLVYKANIRGAKQEWSKIVEAVEEQTLQSESALDYLLSKLINRAEAFKSLADRTLVTLEQVLQYKGKTIKPFALDIISVHIAKSDYAARIMEIAMHSLIQVMIEAGVFGSAEIKPLSQMRSANKKHGNIGDVEILENGEIVEAWDSKYGKTYLRDEIEELSDKLVLHPQVTVAGFVISGEPDRLDELTPRLHDIEGMYGVRIEVVTFNEWVSNQFDRAAKDELIFESELADNWLRAYTESIAQKRRDLAPIDEPCYEWLNELNTILLATLKTFN